MSKRLFSWVNKGYVKVTLPQTDCSFYLVTIVSFASQNISRDIIHEPYVWHMFSQFLPNTEITFWHYSISGSLMMLCMDLFHTHLWRTNNYANSHLTTCSTHAFKVSRELDQSVNEKESGPWEHWRQFCELHTNNWKRKFSADSYLSWTVRGWIWYTQAYQCIAQYEGSSKSSHSYRSLATAATFVE